MEQEGQSPERPQANGLTFLKAKEERRDVSRELEKIADEINSGGVTDAVSERQRDLTGRETELNERMQTLITDFDEQGGLDDVKELLDEHKDELQDLSKLSETGELTREQARSFRRGLKADKRSSSDWTKGELDENNDDEYAGIREHYFREEADKILDEVDNLLNVPHDSATETKESETDSGETFLSLKNEKNRLLQTPEASRTQEQTRRLDEIDASIALMVETVRAAGILEDIDQMVTGQNFRLQLLSESAEAGTLSQQQLEQFLGNVSDMKAAFFGITSGEGDTDPQYKGIREHYALNRLSYAETEAERIYKSRPMTFQEIQAAITPLEAKVGPELDTITSIQDLNTLLDRRVSDGVLTKDDRKRLEELQSKRSEIIREYRETGELRNIEPALYGAAFYRDRILSAKVDGVLSRQDLDAFRAQMAELGAQLATTSVVEETSTGKFKGIKSFLISTELRRTNRLTQGLAHDNVQQGQISPDLDKALKDLVEHVGLSTAAMNAMIESQRKALYGAATLDFKIYTPDNLNGIEMTSEQKRNQVRGFLGIIESSNRQAHDFAISSLVKVLESSLDDMEPSLQAEVRTRLAIHDSSELMKLANGWISRPTDVVGYGYSIGSAANEAKVRGHAIGQEVLSTFFENRIEGHDTALAWDLLQEANYNYRDIVADMNTNELLTSRPRGEVYARVEARYRVDIHKAFVSGTINTPENSHLRDAILRAGVSETRLRAISTDVKNAQDLLSKVVKISGTDTRVEFVKTKEDLTPQQILDLQSNFGADVFDRLFEGLTYTPYDDEAALGETISNYHTESNSSKKAAVGRYLVNYLANVDSSLEDPVRKAMVEGAEISMRMADNLALSLGEHSVWNKSAAAGNDEPAEFMGLQRWRQQREAKGRDKGPPIHKDIPGFGTSTIRYFHTIGFEVLDENGNPEKDKDGHVVMNETRDNINEPLYSKQILEDKGKTGQTVIEKLNEGAWEFDRSVRNARYAMMKKTLMEMMPKAPLTGGGLTVESLQKLTILFETADPKGETLNLKRRWVEGMLSMAHSYRRVLLWRQQDLEYLESLLTVDIIGRDGKPITFMSKEDYRLAFQRSGMVVQDLQNAYREKRRDYGFA